MLQEQELFRVLGRIEEGQTSFNRRLDLLMEQHDKRSKDIEDRISIVEKKVWYASGVAGLATILLGLIGYKHAP